MYNIAVLKSRKNLNKKKSWIKHYWLKKNKISFTKTTHNDPIKHELTFQIFNDIYYI